MIEVKGFDKIKKNLKASLDDSEHEKIMSEIGLFFMFKVKERTAKGKDYKGSYFKPYTEGYKKIRKKKGLPSSIVDLFFTGRMMGAMSFKSTKKYIHLFFMNVSSSSKISAPAKAYYLHQKRKFFKLSFLEVRQAGEIYKKRILKVMEG